MITILKTKTADEFTAVELDSGETLKIPHGSAGLYRLAAGQVLEQEEYAQLKAESQRYRCRKTALDYLAICPRSRAEMERHLAKKGFDHDLATEITAALLESGYIDDADYAARYICNRLGKKLVGKNLLTRELQKRGVHRDIIRQALRESASLQDTFDEVYDVALKKYATLKSKKNPLAKLAYFLQGRGFDGEVITGVIEKIRSGEREEEE
jgi:regulatory protein